MACLHYLAYGSNLHPIRLTERVPSARLIGTHSLSGFRLHFHKRGQDDSGKCNLVHTGHEHDVAHTALYRMDVRHKADLDGFEGEGYEAVTLQLRHAGESLECFAYIALDAHIDDRLMPYHWYKGLVMLGGDYHGFPADYMSRIKNIESTHDPDHERRKLHDVLIDRLRATHI